MFRSLFPFAFFIALSFTAFLVFNLMSCKNEKKPSDAKTEKTETSEDRISKIEITEFGKVTTLAMSYEKDAISIEFQPYKGNVESRIELNKDKQIREIISGSQRIQYLYDEEGRQIGIFNGNGTQQIMFDYEGENISAQHTIMGNDTVISFFYTYEDGLPAELEIKGKVPYSRTYKLEYTDIKNQLSGYNEMVLPAETSGLLGIPAMYGEKYLKKATRIDAGAAKDEPLKESYTPSFEVVEFEISKTGKQEVLKLVSDGSRQWNATIHW